MDLVDSAFTEFTLDCKLRGLGVTTVNTYQKVWSIFIRDMDINELSELNSQTIKRYTMFLLQRDLS